MFQKIAQKAKIEFKWSKPEEASKFHFFCSKMRNL